MYCNYKYYYYEKNGQNDIIGLLDETFNKVATYEYDSWGKILSVKDNNGNEIVNPNHIAHINPFRYRSYYYDRETELYYLNSRYYNPEWGRFLNADGIIGANGDILSYNLYAYASNNPIMFSDPSGYGIISIIKKAVSIVANLLIKSNSNITAAVNNALKTNKNKLPTNGIPNTSVPKPNGDIRVYGPDGKAIKDIDSSHPTHHPELPNPHVHDWEWDGDSVTRGPAYDPNAILIPMARAGAVYLTYRAVRMTLSLVPALWWTIPANLVTP